MHIPDGYLSPETCLLMYAAAIPVVSYASKQVIQKVKEIPERLALIGIGAASSFLIMMFNLPIPGGTSAHAVGGTILAILIGPFEAVLSITLTLILQAFIFGDGGILTLGANIINMAVIMPLFGYSIYSYINKYGYHKLAIGLSSYFGINLAALVVGIELGLQPLLFHTASGQALYNPYPLSVALPAMLGTHLCIVGFVEAGFSIVIYQYVIAHNKQMLGKQTADLKPWILGLITLAILTPLGTLASQPAWGEWTANYFHGHIPFGIKHAFKYHAILSDYQIGSLQSFGSALMIALLFILILIILIRGIHYVDQKRT